MINKVTLTKVQMQEAVEYWLNNVALKSPVTVTHIETMTDGLGRKFEVTMTKLSVDPENKTEMFQ